ncbi:DUF1684 domain-containing protein [Nakamurella deserti]|uniref:DUF1684 domain-containing protein n=1 Tax=Nakamurella deserti TaxID=2164074 RepID=UPI000DBE6A63|nr:DUF1684 domain-containing protein [Nakamurella deserti]
MTSTTPTDLQTDWQRWHTARETDLAAPHGWLSIVDLIWLADTPATTSAVPGRFSLTPDGTARYEPDGTTGVTLGDTGRTVDAAVTADGPEGGSDIWLRHGAVAVELIRRSERLAIRVRDSTAPTLTRFRGVPAYPATPGWVLTGTFLAGQPHPVVVGAATPGLTHVVTVVGTVDVEIDGVPQRLRAVSGPGGRAQLAFHDPTNGLDTAPWRTLTFDATPGPVTLDFNRTVNLPFAFSAFGTCPRPVEGNVVTRPVTAGERTPDPV